MAVAMRSFPFIKNLPQRSVCRASKLRRPAAKDLTRFRRRVYSFMYVCVTVTRELTYFPGRCNRIGFLIGGYREEIACSGYFGGAGGSHGAGLTLGPGRSEPGHGIVACGRCRSDGSADRRV